MGHPHDCILWIFVTAGTGAAIAGGTGWLPLWAGFAIGAVLAIFIATVILASHD